MAERQTLLSKLAKRLLGKHAVSVQEYMADEKLRDPADRLVVLIARDLRHGDGDHRAITVLQIVCDADDPLAVQLLKEKTEKP